MDIDGSGDISRDEFFASVEEDEDLEIFLKKARASDAAVSKIPVAVAMDRELSEKSHGFSVFDCIELYDHDGLCWEDFHGAFASRGAQIIGTGELCKCHFSTIVTIIMRQFEDMCHNSMHYYVNI